MSLGRYRVCPEPGCPRLVLVGTGKCAPHRSEDRKQSDAKRPSASARGYGAEWRKVRDAFLARYPDCETEGCHNPATVADHHPTPRHELVRQGCPDPDAWHRLVARCASCHSSKTAKQDGGFGRASEYGAPEHVEALSTAVDNRARGITTRDVSRRR